MSYTSALFGEEGVANLDPVCRYQEEIDKLKQELRVMEEILDYSSDSIVVGDENGIVLLVNKTFEQIAGARPDEVIGRSVYDLEKEAVFTPSVIALVLKEKRRITIIQTTRVGKVIVTGVPIFREDGTIHRVISNAKDLKEFKTLQNYLAGYDEVLAVMTPNPPQSVSIVASSNTMKDILLSARIVAKAGSTVLIAGESGVGKEVIARYIHQLSGRKNFVQINCGAIPESLLESELFGYEAGAFTGAGRQGKVGLIEAADGGTLFLDEISEMPLNMQVKLLTALQNRQVNRVGGTNPIDIDVRYIAATNKDLRKLVATGQFRLDLYYRLNVIPIFLPPLRERKEDIRPLIEGNLEKLNRIFQKNVSLSPAVVEILLAYDWPGNIRELENVIERIVVTASKSAIDEEDLPLFSTAADARKPISVNRLTTLEQAFEEVEKQLVLLAHKKFRSSYKLAKALGISQSSAHRKMQRYLQQGEIPPDNE